MENGNGKTGEEVSIFKPFRGRHIDQELASAFAKRLNEAMGKMTYVELGKAIGAPANTIWAYGHGTSFPSMERLVLIAKALGKSIDWLLLGAETERPKDGVELTILRSLRQAEMRGVDRNLVLIFIDTMIAAAVPKNHAEPQEKAS